MYSRKETLVFAVVTSALTFGVFYAWVNAIALVVLAA